MRNCFKSVLAFDSSKESKHLIPEVRALVEARLERLHVLSRLT